MATLAATLKEMVSDKNIDISPKSEQQAQTTETNS